MSQDTTSPGSVALDKLWKAFLLQLSALLTTVLLVVSESGFLNRLLPWPIAMRGDWGPSTDPVLHLAVPLWCILIAGVLATVVNYIIYGIGTRAVTRSLDNHRKAVRKADLMILTMFGVDVLGLGVFMLISRGSPDLVALFTLIMAVVVMMICPNAAGGDPCYSCAGGHRRIWGRFPLCAGPPLVAISVYVLGLFGAGPFLTALGGGQGPAWLPQEPARMNSVTIAVFAVIGVVQLVAAKVARETAALDTDHGAQRA